MIDDVLQTKFVAQLCKIEQFVMIKSDSFLQKLKSLLQVSLWNCWDCSRDFFVTSKSQCKQLLHCYISVENPS